LPVQIATRNGLISKVRIVDEDSNIAKAFGVIRSKIRLNLNLTEGVTSDSRNNSIDRLNPDAFWHYSNLGTQQKLGIWP
jgi:hypothetical protein